MLDEVYPIGLFGFVYGALLYFEVLSAVFIRLDIEVVSIMRYAVFEIGRSLLE